MKTMQKIVSLSVFTFFFSCSSVGIEPINYNKDNCDNCKMSISDKRFACELVTEKGKVFKFDDLICLINYQNEHKDQCKKAGLHVNDFLSPNQLVPVQNLFYLKGQVIGSPMGGDMAAFSNKDSAGFYAELWQSKVQNWEALLNEE